MLLAVFKRRLRQDVMNGLWKEDFVMTSESTGVALFKITIEGYKPVSAYITVIYGDHGRTKDAFIDVAGESNKFKALKKRGKRITRRQLNKRVIDS